MKMNADTEEQHLNAFTAWFTSNGGTIHPAVEFAYSTARGAHLRVVAETVSPGTIVLSCPHNLTLSALNAADISEKFPLHSPPAPVPSHVGGGLPFFPRELLARARPQCVAAFFLCYQVMLGRESWWRAYIACLPRPPGLSWSSSSSSSVGGDSSWPAGGLGELDTPVDWTSDAERALLTGTAVERGVVELEGRWRAEWDEWRLVMASWGKGVGAEGSFNWPTFKWAMTILGSRAFSSAQICAVRVDADDSSNPNSTSASHKQRRLLELYDPHMLLYPGIDFLNHDPTTRNCWVQDGEMFGVRVYETRLERGDEVVYSYGRKDNGQLLLSYGFCLQDNPDESFALKLAPLGVNPIVECKRTEQAQDVQAYFTTAVEEEETAREDQHSRTTVPHQHTMVEPSDMTERLASHAPPPSENTEQNTYYIRIPSASHPGYPTPDPQMAPFPHALLNTLTAKLANAREVEQTMPLDLDDGCLHEQLHGRVRLAVALLLLRRLRMELARLVDGAGQGHVLGGSSSATSQLERGKTYRRRKIWAVIYREGQGKLLREVIRRLEEQINVALSLESPTSLATRKRGNGALITLAGGLLFVRYLLDHSSFRSFTNFDNGLEAVFGSSQDVEGWRADGLEEDVWTLVVGAALLTVESPTNNDHDDDDERNRRMKSWLMQLASTYASKSPPVDEGKNAEEQDIAGHVSQVLVAIREALDMSGADTDTSIWSTTHWTMDVLAKAVRIVQDETLQVVMSSEAYVRIRADEVQLLGEEGGDGEEMEIEEWETVVALYIGD